ncbi:MAG: dihydrolipoamide acetyltransferase family protein [Simkaniaceae bacterium]|nr:dihydrolipoamide acetyltransferase family protein [Simkaniaceae bacterium]
MEEIRITLPKLGESITRATVVRWLKAPGDPVELDEPLLEVSTDKVNSEIPSPVTGVIRAIHVQPEEEIEVGALIAVIVPESEEEGIDRSSSPVTPVPVTPTRERESPSTSSEKALFTPAVLRIATQKGISPEELGHIPATGAGGRLSKRDIEEYLAQKEENGEGGEAVERIKMSVMRKTIAENMTRSFYEAPHASLLHEVDVTRLMRMIDERKERFRRAHDCKLTITSFILKAMAHAVSAFPLINSSLEGDAIIVKRSVNIGIAVSVDQGILVPVIRKCNELALTEVAKQVGRLSTGARKGSLRGDAVREGTITMTNFGISGVLAGTPIIRYPEAAIVGIGAVRKEPVVSADDGIAVRSIMRITLTFDHRIIDGMYGCGFLVAIKERLESAIVPDEL